MAQNQFSGLEIEGLPETTQYQFTIQEMTKILIREQGITSGHWEIQLGFATTGGSINLLNQPSYPSIVNQITTVMLRKTLSPTLLSVDASTIVKSKWAEFPEEM